MRRSACAGGLFLGLLAACDPPPSPADMGDLPWPVQNAGKEGAGGTDARTGATQVNKMNAGGPITIVGAEDRSMIVYNVDWEISIAIEHNAIDDDRTGHELNRRAEAGQLEGRAYKSSSPSASSSTTYPRRGHL